MIRRRTRIVCLTLFMLFPVLACAPVVPHSGHADRTARLSAQGLDLDHVAHLPLVGEYTVDDLVLPPAETDDEWLYYTPVNEILALAHDPVGDRVIASTNGGLIAWNLATGRFERLGFVRSEALAVDAEGGIWVNGGPDDADGVSRLDRDGTWATVVPPGARADRFDVGAIMVADGGAVWFGEWTWYPMNVWRLNADGTWDVFTPDDGLVNESIGSFAPDGDGGVWVAHRGFDEADRVISHIHADGGIETFDRSVFGEEGERLHGTIDVAVGPDGRPWFTTGDGFVRRELDGSWTVHLYEYEGHSLGETSTIAFDDHGGAWLNGDETLVYIAPDGSARYVPDEDEFRVLYVERPEILDILLFSTEILAMPAGGLVIGNWKTGLATYDAGGEWSVLSDPDGDVPFQVDEIEHAGAMTWIVGSGRLYASHVRRGWTAIPSVPSGGTWPLGLAVSATGRVWSAIHNRAGTSNIWYRDPDGTIGSTALPPPHHDALVRSIAPDPAGGMWFAPQRFDGAPSVALHRDDHGAWTSVTAPAPHDESQIYSISSGVGGDMWFATTAGLGRLDAGGGWTFWADLEGVALVNAIDVAVEPDGTVWAVWNGLSGSMTGGVGRMDPDGTWHVATKADGLVGSHLRAVAPDGTGGAWFATDVGMSRWRADGSWQSIGAVDGAPCDSWDVEATPDGSVWFACSDLWGRGHRIALDGTITSLPPVGPVRMLAAGPDGGVFALDARDQVHRVAISEDESTLTWIIHQFRMPGNIADLVADADGGLWAAFVGVVGESAGLGYRSPDDGLWRNFATGDGLPDPQVSAVGIGDDGSVWTGMANVRARGPGEPSGGGLARLVGEDRWVAVDGVEDGVRAIVPDGDGGLWIATELNPGSPSIGTGLHHRDSDGEMSTFRLGDPPGALMTDEVRDIVVDEDGMAWLATDIGIVTRSRDGEWRTIGLADGLPHTDVRDLDIDDVGRLWAATAVGVVRLVDSAVEKSWTTEDGLSSNDVRAVAVDAFGRAWFGTGTAGTSVWLRPRTAP